MLHASEVIMHYVLNAIVGLSVADGQTREGPFIYGNLNGDGRLQSGDDVRAAIQCDFDRLARHADERAPRRLSGHDVYWPLWPWRAMPAKTRPEPDRPKHDRLVLTCCHL